MEMTKEWLKKHCKEQNQYGTPSLNDKLYLHFKGFQCIENLEEYTGLKSLFLEGNALDSLYGLEALVELKCLFLQQNCISEIEEGALDNCTELTNINMSNNTVKKISNLSACSNLHTLQLANNYLSTYESISHLRECPSINVLDLSTNRLDGEPEEFITLFESLPKLAVLYMQGNPVLNKFRHYRKNMIARIPTLTYLDDRPIFLPERRCAEAWFRGGLEAEREERALMAAEKKATEDRQFEFMRKMVERKMPQKVKKTTAEGEEDISQESEEDDEEEDDSEEEEEPEPNGLLEARKKLAQYSARPGEQEPPELTAERKQVTNGIKATWSPFITELPQDGNLAVQSEDISLDIEIINPNADDESRFEEIKNTGIDKESPSEFQVAAAAFVQGLNDLD